jgi:hypothetical protein
MITFHKWLETLVLEASLTCKNGHSFNIPDWLRDNTIFCPKCKIVVQRSPNEKQGETRVEIKKSPLSGRPATLEVSFLYNAKTQQIIKITQIVFIVVKHNQRHKVDQSEAKQYVDGCPEIKQQVEKWIKDRVKADLYNQELKQSPKPWPPTP